MAGKDFILRFLSELGSSVSDAQAVGNAAEKAAQQVAKANETMAQSATSSSKTQDQVVQSGSQRFRKLTSDELEATRARTAAADVLKRQQGDLQAYGEKVRDVGANFAHFATILSPLGIKLSEEGFHLRRVGIGISQLGEESGSAAPLLGVLARGAVGALVAIAALAVAYKGLKAVLDASTKEDKAETGFAVLGSNLKQAGERIEEIKRQSADFKGFKTEDILKGAENLDKFSAGALKGEKDLRMLADLATQSGKSMAEMGTQVGRLYNELRDGTKASPTLRALQDVGLISLEARKKIDELQKQGAKGSEVWAVAAADLNRFNGANKIAGDTFSGTATQLGNAWDNLLATLGRPVKEYLTPVLERLAGWLTSLSNLIDTLQSKWDIIVGLLKISAALNLAPNGSLDGLGNAGAGQLGTGVAQLLTGGGKGGGGPTTTRATPSRPPNTAKGGGKKDNDMEDVRLLTEKVRVAQQDYNHELETTKLLQELGSISAVDARQREAESAQHYLTTLKKLQDELEQERAIQLKIGNDRGVAKLEEQWKQVNVQLLKQQLILQNLTVFGSLKTKLAALQKEWADVGKQISDLAGKTITSAIDGVAGSITDLITGTNTWGQTFARIGREVLNGLIQIGLRQAINYTANLLQIGSTAAAGSTATAASAVTQAAAGTVVAAAWAPAAAAATVGSYGIAAVVGIALAAAAIGAIIGMLVGHADGGMISGPGGPRSDSVVARLSAGEFVMPAHAVQHYGPGMMESLRSMQYSSQSPNVASPRYGGGGGGGAAAAAGAGGGSGGGSATILVHDRRDAVKVMTDHPEFRNAQVRFLDAELRRRGLSR